MPTPGLTDGRVSGKKHSVSDAARTASLTDLRRWPGDGFLGKKQSRNSDFGGRIPTSGGAGSVLEASMPGRWRCVHPAGLRWSLPRRAGWRLWVLNTAAYILAHSFASPLAGTCKKTPRVFSDGTCAPAEEEVPARATAAPVP